LLDDMSGHGDKTHGAAFRKLLTDLNFPQGTHAFWPMSAPRSASPDTIEADDSAFFASGMAVLRPELVIILSRSVPQSLGLPPLRPHLPIVHRGSRYLLLYDINQMAQDTLGSTPRYAGLVRYVQSLIRGV
jgi:hypothetical protein